MIFHAIVFLVNMVFSSGYCFLLLIFFSILNSLIFLARSARKRTYRDLNSKVPDRRRPAKILSFYCSLPYLSVPFSELRLLESSEHYVLMLTTIANFIIRSSIVAPDQSSLKPDTHDETFVCNLCMQLLCVPYTTVQTMQLNITCCSFPLKLCILFQHGAY